VPDIDAWKSSQKSRGSPVAGFFAVVAVVVKAVTFVLQLWMEFISMAWRNVPLTYRSSVAVMPPRQGVRYGPTHVYVIDRLARVVAIARNWPVPVSWT